MAGASFNSNNVPQVLFDDFYLSTVNTYNETQPRPYGLVSVQGVHPVVTITPILTNSEVRLYWSGGTLASAPALTGPWMPLAGGNTNVPYYVVPPTNAQLFFRTQ